MIDLFDPDKKTWRRPPPVRAPANTTVLGLVVGDVNTAPAIVAVRYENVLITPGDAMYGERPIFETRYSVLNAETLATGSSHPALAARVNRIAKRLYDRDATGDYHILADASDIGRPVIDAIKASIIPQVLVTSVRVDTSDNGDLSLLWRVNATVGLTYLVSRLQALLQNGRLTLPAALTDLAAAIRDQQHGTPIVASSLRALALACGSEFQAVTYGPSVNRLPSPIL